MAKKDIGLGNEPKIDPTKPLRDQGFILVTDENRKNAVKIGRIFYTIEIGSKKNKLLNFFQIYPCFKKGWYNVANFPWDLSHPYTNGKKHWKVYYNEDSNYYEWAARFKWLIDRSINKNLYFNINDPILDTHEANRRP